MLLWKCMENRVQCGSILGHNDGYHWAQTIKTRFVYGVVEVSEETGNASTKGLSIIKKITDCCAQHVPSVSALQETLTSIAGPSVSLVLIVLAGTKAYMYVKGTGHAYIKRNGTLAGLLHAEGEIEGSIRKGDMFLLMTEGLGEVTDESVIMTVFDHLPAEDVAEKLTTKIWMNAQGKSYAGIVVSVFDVIEEGTSDVSVLSPAPEEDKKIERNVYEPVGNTRERRLGTFSVTIKKYLRKISHKLEDRTIRILVGIAVLILVCIGIGVYREIAGRTGAETLALIKTGEEKITEGDALLSMSPVKARVAFEEGKQALTIAEKKVSNKSKDGRKIADLLQTINEKLTEATRTFDVTPEAFFDVALVKEGTSISSMSLWEDSLIALDTKNATVFSVTLPSKNGSVIGGPEFAGGAISTSSNGTVAYVLTDSGINAITAKSKVGVSGVIKKQTEWGDVREIVAFGGNLYILDVGKSRIWKYVGTDAPSGSASASTKTSPGMTFTELREYFNPDVYPDLTGSTSLAIDGFVWLGGAEGAVRKFAGGREEVFTLTGVEPSLSEETRIYTDDTLEHLYILEEKTKRVVVTDKDGIYTAQYRFPDTLAPTSLAASEKNGIILLLSDGKLYGIPIR